MIGIITFHGSHNYGSVLQAYATQKMVKDLGYESEIINFRMKSQKDYYSLYPFNYGIRTIIGNGLLLPYHSKRIDRANKFENFINDFYSDENSYSNEFVSLDDLLKNYLNDLPEINSVAIYKTDGTLVRRKNR